MTSSFFKMVKYPVLLLLLVSGFGGSDPYRSCVGDSSRSKGKKKIITVAHHRTQTKPYRITNSQMKRRLFVPQKYYEYSEVGIASYYGGADKIFHGRKTATGSIFNKNSLSAAHRTLPIPCVVRVTNLENGKSIVLKVTDRGPYVKPHERIIDVSEKAAKVLGFHKCGTVRVRVETLVDESLKLFNNKNKKKGIKA